MGLIKKHWLSSKVTFSKETSIMKILMTSNIYLKLMWCPTGVYFFLLGFTPCKAEQPLGGMELQEKKHKKYYRIQKICLERTYG